MSAAAANRDIHHDSKQRFLGTFALMGLTVIAGLYPGIGGVMLPLSEKAAGYLQKLCLEIPGRQVGSQGNLAATDFFAEVMASFGFIIEMPVYDCMDWSQTGAQLAVNGTSLPVFASPYSTGCEVRAPLAAASTIEELQRLEPGDGILLLRGDMTRHQLMPKNFPFYNPEEHKQTIRLLESKNPLAIIAATSRDPEMVGSMYPFPLIEDGDFDIPSVYMTDEAGDRLAEYIGKTVMLKSSAIRIPSQGCNVIARKGPNPGRRVVLFAHIDAKMGTPGALDNASGVVVLLMLAELLSTYTGKLGIEIVALNGEDYYSNPGEQQYLALNAGHFDEIIFGINIDGAGYYQGRSVYSLYDCPTDCASAIHKAFSAYGDVVEGDSWYQGDHMLFSLNQRPALAITSEYAMELLAEIIHTSEDRPEIINTATLVRLALALRDVVLHLSHILV